MYFDELRQKAREIVLANCADTFGGSIERIAGMLAEIAQLKKAASDCRWIPDLGPENERLTRELEAARKVADAAVNYMDLDSGPDADAELWIALDDAVREYRAARPLEQRIDAALEGLTDEVKLAKNCR